VRLGKGTETIEVPALSMDRAFEIASRADAKPVSGKRGLIHDMSPKG